MKTKFLTLLMLFAFVTIASADCTVTTDCEVRTYEGNNVSASVASGVVTVVQDGNVIDTFNCDGNSVSVSCSGSGGSGNQNGGGFDFDFDFDFDFGFDFGNWWN